LSILSRKELFELLLNMLHYTTPYPYDIVMQHYYPKGGMLDGMSNYFYTVGKSDTLFCCHVDTVGSNMERTSVHYKNGILGSRTNGACLGGDDRCGILACIALINANVPGTYIFHTGEEKGCIGSNYIAANKDLDLTKFKRAIGFDRKGTTSIITSMCSKVTCSAEFAEELASQIGLNYKQDKGGASTDVLRYLDKIPEITNLSVGYHEEHSSNETIDVDWLIDELIPALIQVDWESLPVSRVVGKEFVYGTTYNHNNFESNKAVYGAAWSDYNKYYGVDIKKFPFSDNKPDNDSYIVKANGVYIILPENHGKACDFCSETEPPFQEVDIYGKERLVCDDCVEALIGASEVPEGVYNDNEIEEDLSNIYDMSWQTSRMN